MDLSEILFRLLHDEDFRVTLRNGHIEGIAAIHRDALRTVDFDQVEKTAKRIQDKLLSGNHQGAKGLGSVFTDTLAYFKIAHQNADDSDRRLITAFLRSRAYRRYSELPFAHEGICIEESFHQFISEDLCTPDHPLEAIARNEFLISLFRTLSQNPNPSFSIDEKWIRQTATSKFSVQLYSFQVVENQLVKRPHFVLYACTGGNFVSGEITPLIADLLFHEKPFQKIPDLARQHRVGLDVVLNAHHGLMKMGILPRAH